MTKFATLDDILTHIGTRKVVDDTRKLTNGDVLIWDSRIAPQRTHDVLADARARHAGLIITDASVEDAMVVTDAGAVLAAWAQRQSPRQPHILLGVTGTSGKTSVAWFVRQLAQLAGYKSASVGTLGVMRSDTDFDEEYTGFTSPNALKLHPILDGLAAEGVDVCAMEISSHALALRRADAVTLCAAGYTNFSQDHLDFHRSLDEYFFAKMRLFTELLPEKAPAVINVGRSELWPVLSVLKQRQTPVLTVGTAHAELVVRVNRSHARGLDITILYEASPIEVSLPLIGTFQAENLAVALGLLVAGGVPWARLTSVISQLTCVPGRMDVIPSMPSQPAVVVDYAHKPDALEKALHAMRPLTRGKLWVVFGCGGNRDATKRPLMGAIAARLADNVVVTDDNPRHEDAALIRGAIVDGATHAGTTAQIFTIADRSLAIAYALKHANHDDVILVAGKGHEQGQIVGDTVIPFDDRKVVAGLLKQ